MKGEPKSEPLVKVKAEKMEAMNIKSEPSFDSNSSMVSVIHK